MRPHRGDSSLGAKKVLPFHARVEGATAKSEVQPHSVFDDFLAATAGHNSANVCQVMNLEHHAV